MERVYLTHTPHVAVYQGEPKQGFEAGTKAEAMGEQYLFPGFAQPPSQTPQGLRGAPAQVCGPTHNGLGLYKAAVIRGQPFGSISSIVVLCSQLCQLKKQTTGTIIHYIYIYIYN